ncbi:MAG: hypothetical protein KGL39_30250 [Patescibacteria group bacterium]|nr:hypothetical protein [Patescibacteria group bacterium]
MKSFLITLIMALAWPARAQLGLDDLVLGGAAAQQNAGSTTAVQFVDSFIDFHAEVLNNGTNFSTNSLTASSYGDTNWYPILATATTNFHIFQGFSGTNAHFPVPISVGGQTFSTVGTNWLKEPLDIGTNKSETIQFAFPAQTLCEATWFFYFSAITNAGNQVNMDWWSFYDNPPAINEYQIATATTNQSFQGYIHFQKSDSTYAIWTPYWLTNGPVYYAELVWDGEPGATNAMAYVKYFDAATGNWLGSSCTYLLKTNSTQDQFQRLAGYINPGSNIWGNVYSSGMTVNWSHVNTNRIPWYPNAPMAAAAIQSGSGQISVTWADTCDLLNPYQVDESEDGGAWINNITNRIQGDGTNAFITGLTVGSNYQFRVSALFPPANRQSGYATTGTVTVTNIPDTAFVISETGSSQVTYTGTNGFAFIPSVNMTVGSLGMYAYSSGLFPDNTVTVVLTDSSCTVLATASVDISAHDSAFHWTSITPVTLTSGATYKIGFANPNSSSFYYGTTLTTTSDGAVHVDWATSSGGCTGCIFCNATAQFGANFKYH